MTSMLLNPIVQSQSHLTGPISIIWSNRSLPSPWNILFPLRIWWSYETSFEKNRYMHKSQQSCISCQGFMNFLAATPGSPRVKNNLAPNLLPSRFHRYFFMLLNPWLWDVSMSESITPQLNRLSWFTLTLVPSKYFTLTEGKGREHNPCG